MILPLHLALVCYRCTLGVGKYNGSDETEDEDAADSFSCFISFHEPVTVTSARRVLLERRCTFHTTFVFTPTFILMLFSSVECLPSQ
jgi:hypothetical protein